MHSIDRPFRIQFLAALGGVALILAACSSSTASTAPSAAAPSVAAPSTAASAAAGGPVTLATTSGAVGTYLTGADGKTLYVFTPDSKDKTACVDACATKWPPVVIVGAAPAAPHRRDRSPDHVRAAGRLDAAGDQRPTAVLLRR